MTTNFRALSPADIVREFDAMATDAQAVFGSLDHSRLNWRPDVARWSVAQCFDHLLNANREMFRSVDEAMDPSLRRTVWQRLPLLPVIFGSIMIKSLIPGGTRKFTAPETAQPAASDIDARIVQRFVEYQREAAARVRTLQGRDVDRTIMVSPFVSFITYSVLDGLRIIVTHQRRHFEQARRVTEEPAFPRAGVV